MKRVLVVAMVVFALALQVSTVSAGGIRVDPGGAVSLSAVNWDTNQVRTESAGGIRVDPGGAVSLSAVNWDTNLSCVPADPGMNGSVTVQGGKATPVLFCGAAAGDTVTPDLIKPDPTITK